MYNNHLDFHIASEVKDNISTETQPIKGWNT